MESKTMWEKIADHLISKNIEVYPPATHVGECENPYVVLKDDGGSQYGKFSTKIQYYTVLCYVPKDKYTELKRYEDICEKAMNELSPMVMPTGYKTPDFYDDSIKAHMSSLQYRNYVRDELL